MKKLLMCILFLALSTVAFGQTSIKGKVIASDDSAGVPGVAVRIKGANRSTQTDLNGVFTLLLPDSLISKNITLIVSYIGFQAKEVLVDTKQYLDQSFIKIIIQPSSSALTEIIVTGHTTKSKPQDRIPMFPWPPPDFTVSAILNKNAFKDAKILADVDSILATVLDTLRYSDISYFYVPNGFALVTRIEQIQEDGKPLDPPNRWSVDIKAYNHLSWESYIKALIFPPKGYFRIIVFVITDKPFTSSGKKPSRKTAISWLEQGLNVLPSSIGTKKFKKGYSCTAVIYEYKKDETEEAQLLIPGTLTAGDHLEKSKISLLLITH